ncbi:MAG: sulfur carrier protein ThiS [Desulfopila sp.]
MTIRVLINDEPYDFDEGASVADAVRYLGMSGGGLAVAINGEVLPQKRWQDSTLAAGDRIMLIRATHGG